MFLIYKILKLENETMKYKLSDDISLNLFIHKLKYYFWYIGKIKLKPEENLMFQLSFELTNKNKKVTSKNKEQETNKQNLVLRITTIKFIPNSK